MNDTCCDKCANRTGCGCCMVASEYEKVQLTEVVQNDERQCTDIPCCCLLLACIVIEILIIVSCSKAGANYNLLLHGTDYNGILCDDNNLNGPYTVWPSLSDYDIRLCSWSCNSFTNDAQNNLMIDKYESSLFMNAYCVPKEITELDNIDKIFDDFTSNIERGLSDLATTKWLILIMSFGAILLSFIYLKLISFLSKILIIFTIIMVLIAGILFSWLLIQNGVKNYHSYHTQSIALIEIFGGIVIIIVLIGLFFAVWFSRKNIEFVIDLLNEANHAIYDMKLTLIFPIWMSLLGIAYIAYWTTEALYIYSVKMQTTETMPNVFVTNGGYPNTYQHFQFDYKLMKKELIWHFIVLFYSVQVLIYFSYMVLAGVFSDWYFSEWLDKANKYKERGNGIAQLSSSPICESLWRVPRYHLGSLAFGAAIITLIRMVEGFVTYISKKTKHAKNPITKCIFCVMSCGLKCCECIFNRINKNGFIFTSIYGTSFCYSSYSALQTIIENLGKTVLMTSISKYSEHFGRFIISLLNTGFAVLVMKYYKYYNNNLESYLFPALVIFVISYIISALFMMVFDVAAQTIFLCFLVDESVNVEPKFATDEMKELINSTRYLSTNGRRDSDGNNHTYTAV